MAPNSIRAPLLVAALMAVAVAATSRTVSPLRDIDVCVLYNDTQCVEHVDKCVPCHAWGKVDFCFETKIAAKLPAKFFKCDFPTPPPAQPNVDCQSYLDEVSCDDSPNYCVWCMSAAVPSACYSEEEAKRLPAAVFKCNFPGLAAKQ
ncbi:hypothetical protein CHLNCDRAFT_143122 [Chlorella variabilis]|uniref:Uncharacterized protein n=1 Tax=Chlorella variabilis TaxID=554065 RepID=E1Z9I1_CHLVA|nr:hypothetical protein CHLNCDRAFT_143122 [Chlorella variabilis]EFN57523.1 hypothetical protein CHLNCDRAFT_143122 [Chlorella variabilis]|eukprot:XP_005849625.1 hypothetical protein CHLNCDRAFT_143122 [Chlorella variabilis]